MIPTMNTMTSGLTTDEEATKTIRNDEALSSRSSGSEEHGEDKEDKPMQSRF
jgi:hypothetical protein